jgi:nicotinate-nucleotide adenylyltransferase
MDMNQVNSFADYKNIAVLGGTFNPVHKGHIYMAKKVLDAYPFLDALYLMPNNLTAYKDNTCIASNEDRLKMLELASSGEEKIKISTLDMVRGGITYTIDTLTDIKRANADVNIFFVIGADSLSSFKKWYVYRDILKSCTLVVIDREGESCDLQEIRNSLIDENPCADIRILNCGQYPASSTEIRKKIQNNEYEGLQLPDNVLEYILERKLYDDGV